MTDAEVIEALELTEAEWAMLAEGQKLCLRNAAAHKRKINAGCQLDFTFTRKEKVSDKWELVITRISSKQSME